MLLFEKAEQLFSSFYEKSLDTNNRNICFYSINKSVHSQKPHYCVFALIFVYKRDLNRTEENIICNRPY